MHIGCLGEAMIEVIVDDTGDTANLGVAGDSLNTGIYLSRSLRPVHRVSFISMLGEDAFSDKICAFIADNGVNTDFIERHPTKLPGLYSIKTNAEGERSFNYWRNESAAREMLGAAPAERLAAFSGLDAIFLSAISLAILPTAARDAFFDWVGAFRQRGGVFIFDSNYRPTLWASKAEAQAYVEAAWRLCDIALPSVDDEIALFDDDCDGDVIDRLRGWGVGQGALKRGAQGPLPIGFSKAAEAKLPPFSPARHVIDTTAAGDSFNGAYLASLLQTHDPAAALAAGHKLACEVIGHKGAIIPR